MKKEGKRERERERERHLYTTSPTYSSVDGHLGSLHIKTVKAIVNNTAMNIGVPVSFQTIVFIFFRYIPRNGIAGSYGGSICF